MTTAASFIDSFALAMEISNAIRIAPEEVPYRDCPAKDEVEYVLMEKPELMRRGFRQDFEAAAAEWNTISGNSPLYILGRSGFIAAKLVEKHIAKTA